MTKYACFLLTAQGWRFSMFANDSIEANEFILNALDMQKAPMLGPSVLGYDVHILTNQAEDLHKS